MEFTECLFGRRSIRNFTDEKIPEEMIREIVNAGIHAPSACNFAAWKFILVEKENERRAVFRNQVIQNAPYGLLVTYRNDIYVSGRIHGDYIQSAAAAIQNMLLYITSVGLGAVWVCDLPKDRKIRKAFGVPGNFDTVGYIAFGHPKTGDENSMKAMIYHYGDEASFRAHKRRYTLDQVLCRDCFTVTAEDCTTARYPTRMKMLRRKAGSLVRRLTGGRR